MLQNCERDKIVRSHIKKLLLPKKSDFTILLINNFPFVKNH
jgi:hypothetical protein